MLSLSITSDDFIEPSIDEHYYAITLVVSTHRL